MQRCHEEKSARSKCARLSPLEKIGIVQKVFSEKGVGNIQNASEMRQNASEMRQNGSCFIGKRGTSKMREKSVKIASKIRGTPLGENTFWTIPKKTLVFDLV